MLKLQVIGGGRMGEALVRGLVSSGWATTAELRVVEAVAPRRAELAAALPGLEVVDQAGPAQDVLLAVKPADVENACQELARAAPPRRLLSIAAGVTTATLEAQLPGGTAVVRAMPNTPALVGAGVAALAPGSAAGPGDLDWAEAVLSAVGAVVRVSEPQLDAVTGLSGSGPAYVFLVVEALVEAGVLVGLARQTSEVLATGTVLGAARLLEESGRSAADLRADVTSPGGTTAAGLRELERHGARAAFLEAVAAATARSAELGRG
ncbi:MAG: pyrroline-5-carboxylate reductase [Acidimicrobiia bacterium]|nr:pyrroline-5-carboxylate reductase [Acidimicrobiia bacterium]